MTPEQAAAKYPNLFKIGKDRILEIYADNHTLSSYRKCPAYFQEFILNRTGTKGRVWSLDFGSFVHKVMEYFYRAQIDKWEGIWDSKWQTQIASGIRAEPIKLVQDLPNFLQIVKEVWETYDLDYYSQLLWYDKKQKKNIPYTSYTTLGGLVGATNLFLQYYVQHFQRERLRVVGTELSFGRNKEVPILDENIEYNSLSEFYGFRAFYCGRIDLIVDDGAIIGPMDFKTTAYFDGTEREDFKPHDGMQGYVFSAQRMLPEDMRAQGKQCNGILIKHISLKTEEKDGQGRFKTSPISYTPQEMEEWRLRQVRTFTDIYRHVILEEPVYWNTESCTKWFAFQTCPYKILHEAPPLSRESIRKSHFVEIEAWSHERV